MTSLKLIGIHAFVILALTTSYFMAASSSHQVVKGAYYPSYAIDPPSSIDTELFTHIFYAFVNPNGVTFKFNISDSTAMKLWNFTSTLHSKTPPVKALFSVGGADTGTISYSSMVSRADTRNNFILSSIEVARKYGFDGIDLDWESPQNPKEMEDFNLLLYGWRTEVQKEAKQMGRPPLLITAATYFAVDFFLSDVYRKYSVKAINENLDFINAMCYDYHGGWDKSRTGAHAALFDLNSNVSTSYGLTSWIQAGLAQRKLVMGLPLYGRTWKLKDPKVFGIGAPAVDVGPGGGTLTYLQVETFNLENNPTIIYDKETVSTYSVAGTSWIGYDDVRSISVKVKYAQAAGIGGYFFWAVDGDNKWKISGQASRLWSH